MELGAGAKVGGEKTKETTATVSAAAAALVAKPSSARTVERVRVRRSETTSATRQSSSPVPSSRARREWD